MMVQMDKDKKRLIFLDAAKGIGILGVMFGHITALGNPIDRWLSTFKIPIFFLVSGFLICRMGRLFDTSFKEFTLKRGRMLLLPYFSFSFIVILYRIGTRILKEKETVDQIKDLAVDLYKTMSFGGIQALWFLTTLLFAEVIFFLVMRLHLIGRIFCVSLALIVFFGTDGAFHTLEGMVSGNVYKIIRIPVLTLTKGITGFLFLGAGYLLYLLLQKFSDKRYRFVLGVVLFFTNILIFPFNTGVVDYNNMRFGIYPTLYIICALCGSVGFMLILEYLEKYYKFPILTWCGRNSLILMATHGALGFKSIVVKGWANVVSLSSEVCLKYYIECLMTLCHLLIFEYGVVEFVNKKAPVLIGRPKKKE